MNEFDNGLLSKLWTYQWFRRDRYQQFRRFQIHKAAQDQYYRIVDLPVVLQRQMPMAQGMQRTVEVPQIQFIDQVVDVHPAVQQQVVDVLGAQQTVPIATETNSSDVCTASC